MRRLALALELEDALRDGRHDGVMSSLDVGQDLREPLIVVVHLWRPLDARVGIGVVAGRRRRVGSACWPRINS